MTGTAIAEMPIAASHRDPNGRVIVAGDRVVRIVNSNWRPVLDSLETVPALKKRRDNGEVIDWREIDEASAADLLPPTQPGHDRFILEHERVQFPSFPYEWPAEMLAEAGSLTLDIAMELAPHGFRLKDATPFNILFRGPKPVFIDLLSMEPRPSSDPLWRPEGQFTQTFLLPLLAQKRFGLPSHQIFLSHREGLPPSELYPLLNSLARLRPPYLWLVSLPVWLSGKANEPSVYRERTVADTEKALFLFDSVLRRQKKMLARVSPRGASGSVWSEYERSHSYSDAGFAAKRAFVEQAAERAGARSALDIGCNEGAFTFILAEKGASVVAIDYDPVVVGRVWRRAAERGLDVLPLVQNLATPSPPMGWRYGEFPSFLDRASGRFDLVMMLAVIHHLLVTDRVPIDEIFDLAASLTRDWLLIEYVGPADRMFQTIARGRDNLFDWYGKSSFEASAGRRFEIVASEPVPDSDRALYLMRRR